MMAAVGRVAIVALALSVGSAQAATDIDLFFPVPVQGKLANEMQRLIEQFDKDHADIHVTAVYTGSYDDTNLKTRAAIQAGRPPAAVIMSANFIREYAINNDAIALDDLIAKDGQTSAQFMDQFWPALKLNATEQGRVYGVPFQNSTPLLYYSVDAFKDAGLDPDKPPVTWQDWVDDLRKVARHDGSSTTRWGVMFPGTYDYLGWITSGLAMSNGGEYDNTGYGGEVYYTAAEHGRCGAPDRRVCAQMARDARGRDRRQCSDHGILPGPHGDDDPFDRVTVVRAGEHEDAVPHRVPATQPGECGADRWRQPDHSAWQFTRATGGGLDADQMAGQSGDRRRLEPLHRLLRSAHRCL